MALHDSLRDLVSVRGAGVVDEAEELRGALDDFLAEDEATLGELNLLVDAVRLDALRRVLDVMDHGAEPEAAVREAGAALARDRGTDDPTRSCWAIAALCFALGKADESLVRRFRSDAGTMPAPAPPTGPHGRAPEPVENAPAPNAATGGIPAPPDAATSGIPPTPVLGQPPAPVPTPPDPTPPPPTPPQPTVEVRQPPGAGRGLPAPPVVPERRTNRAGTFLLVVLVALIVGGLVTAGYIVLRADDDDPTAADDPTSDAGDSRTPKAERSVPKSAMLVPYVDGDLSRIYQVDTITGDYEPLTPADGDARLPTISPDRRTMTYQVGRSPAPIMLVELATSKERPLFADDSPCAWAGRPAWSPEGSRLALLCDPGKDGTADGIWLANGDGSGVTGPFIDDAGVKGSPTWISETELIYGLEDPAVGSTFWRVDVSGRGGDPQQLDVGLGGHLSHIDWSPAAERLLILVSPGSNEAAGDVYTMDVDGGNPVLVAAGTYAHPVWSPDGKAIGVTLLDAAGTEVLGYVPLDGGDAVAVENPPPGEVAIPVWASR